MALWPWLFCSLLPTVSMDHWFLCPRGYRCSLITPGDLNQMSAQWYLRRFVDDIEPLRALRWFLQYIQVDPASLSVFSALVYVSGQPNSKQSYHALYSCHQGQIFVDDSLVALFFHRNIWKSKHRSEYFLASSPDAPSALNQVDFSWKKLLNQYMTGIFCQVDSLCLLPTLETGWACRPIKITTRDGRRIEGCCCLPLENTGRTLNFEYLAVRCGWSMIYSGHLQPLSVLNFLIHAAWMADEQGGSTGDHLHGVAVPGA